VDMRAAVGRTRCTRKAFYRRACVRAKRGCVGCGAARCDREVCRGVRTRGRSAAEAGAGTIAAALLGREAMPFCLDGAVHTGGGRGCYAETAMRKTAHANWQKSRCPTRV
jgi:hypothetical protein